MKKSNQQGFGFVFLLLAVVVVGLVAFAALRVQGNSATVADSTQVSSKTKVPTKLESPADLQKASKALDETQVDSGVNPDQLDSDLDSLL